MTRAALLSLPLATLLIGATPSPSAVSGLATPSHEEESTVARFRMLFEAGDRMTIPVQLAGGLTLRFVIDTGSEQTGISSERAAEFALKPMGEQSIVGFTGRHIVPTVLIPNLSFARSQRENVEALTFARSTMGADGFLGTDSLSKHRVEFDFVKERMKIVRAPRSPEPRTKASVTVKAQSRNGRLIFSGARINGIKTAVVLDTGSSLSIGNSALRDRLEAQGRLGRLISVGMMTPVGTEISVKYGVVERVVIDGVVLRNFPIAFAAIDPVTEKKLGLGDEPGMFLGMDGLRAFQSVSVDFRHRTVRFVARQYRAEAFRYRQFAMVSRAGFEPATY